MDDYIWILKEQTGDECHSEWDTVGFLFSKEKATQWADRGDNDDPERSAVPVPHHELNQKQGV
jgi:hypothetical protein